jgi:hypothetical protein
VALIEENLKKTPGATSFTSLNFIMGSVGSAESTVPAKIKSKASPAVFLRESMIDSPLDSVKIDNIKIE